VPVRLTDMSAKDHPIGIPFWLVCMLFAAACGGCAYVAPADERIPSYSFEADADSRIGAMLGTPCPTRAMVIDDAHLALTSRLDLIDSADKSIDVQYFIWQNDPSGILVIDHLLAAADRGVRIRGLIDDVQLEGLVSRLSAIGHHPNIEIRIFNPFSLRIGFQLGLFRLAEFAIDGNRLNHRMHNKLLVADNQVAILGGRNIGDDYFGSSARRNFVDTDILLAGDLVGELSTGFDRYWNSHWAVPVEEVFELSLAADNLDALRGRIRRRLAEYPELEAEADTDRIHSVVSKLLNGHEILSSVSVVDDPTLTWGELPDEIAKELTEVALSAETEVLIVSPYLVLTPNLLEIGRTLHERGIKVKVITNSLASNDVVIAHAAYARYRETILDAGAELYEFRGDPEMMAGDIAEDVSLHSKYIVFDQHTVFIGSLNLDPRSLYLNTELGVVLESPSLAAELSGEFERLASPDNAWHVVRTAEGLRWISKAGTVDEQPAKNAWQNFRSKLMMLLPVTNQL
jgi:putative cardiolipin synthase